ncbi:Asp23/Gls24 family envelope stress response protein [Actinokineospora auranticolor]|nr:Asp23/Gls24 family envelope stress response protein [Actinokineospora auranticolor]
MGTAPPVQPRAPGSSTTASERGSLTIANGVVARIAARAATEARGVGGSAHRLFGVPVGAERAGRDVQVEATVNGATVALDVRLSMTYPMPVRRVAEDVRHHLSGRVRALTGLIVSRVEITVTALHPQAATTGRVR